VIKKSKKRYIQENEYKNIQAKKRVIYLWRNFIIQMRKEVNPLIQTELFTDINVKRRNNRILYKKILQLSKNYSNK